MSLKVEKERLNEEINHPEVRLLLEDGSQFGIVSSSQALTMAKEAGLDLLEVSPTANPPVCKIINYGKHKFEKSKRDKELKKKQRLNQVEVKEIKFRPKIDEHDYVVKLKHIKKFLSEGDKVKIVLRYRGREVMFQSIGLELIDRIINDVAEIAVVEKKAEMFGKQQVMIIAPKTNLDK